MTTDARLEAELADVRRNRDDVERQRDDLESRLAKAEAALRATDDFRIADWLKLEAERDEAEAERDAALKEMHARELHHFEEEQKSVELAARIDAALAALAPGVRADPDRIIRILTEGNPS